MAMSAAEAKWHAKDDMPEEAGSVNVFLRRGHGGALRPDPERSSCAIETGAGAAGFDMSNELDVNNYLGLNAGRFDLF